MRTDDEALAAVDAVDLQAIIEAGRGQLDELLASLEPDRLELEKLLASLAAENAAILAENRLTTDH